MRQWFSDLWNLSRIFDKYIPKLKNLMEDVARLELKLNDLRQAELDLEKKVSKLSKESQRVPLDTEINEDKVSPKD